MTPEHYQKKTKSRNVRQYLQSRIAGRGLYDIEQPKSDVEGG